MCDVLVRLFVLDLCFSLSSGDLGKPVLQVSVAGIWFVLHVRILVAVRMVGEVQYHS